MNEIKIYRKEKSYKFSLLRRDIVDRNGVLISRNVTSFHAAINPKLVSNKENFLIKLRLNFPELPIKIIEKNLKKDKYFYLKRINQEDKEKFWGLGEKGDYFRTISI